ncbi:hypothetical protein DRE_02246 [Drechslerella stenobrocha 248]|uniref:FAM192A/Fyv6 N-terminal domain-containing protein n=1 Tax=Drechslerella stenobrocha 248 TaxID=1043628 RepID=W7I8V5_9PEZI|nr:hypothetical protein DRE_02246 [Drechslerella stenobrocha 248]
MSSGFVSSGHFESSQPGETKTDNGTSEAAPEPTGVDAWAAADIAIKIAREKANASGLVGSQEDGKSLYDVLQANKARKQEAFEEKLKFKNQFRALDEGEIEFLDSVVSEQRAEEEAKKKEIEAQLDDFRRLQYEADHDPVAAESAIAEESGGGTWAISSRRKRKKDKDKDSGASAGLKLRKMSDGSRRDSAAKDEEKDSTTPIESATPTDSKPKILNSATAASPTQQSPPLPKASEKEKIPVAATPKPAAGLGGLVAYGSDSDDE